MTETFKSIPGHHYEVSDMGRIRNPRTGQILHFTPNTHGYIVVTFPRINGKQVKDYLHRLILLVFVGPCPDGMEGCHSNGIPTDNRLSNLRWDTHRANMCERRNLSGEIQSAAIRKSWVTRRIRYGSSGLKTAPAASSTDRKAA